MGLYSAHHKYFVGIKCQTTKYTTYLVKIITYTTQNISECCDWVSGCMYKQEHRFLKLSA